MEEEIAKRREKIKILDVSYSPRMIGMKIIIKIEDNNRKHFKDKTLRVDAFPVESEYELNQIIENELANYILYCYRYGVVYNSQKWYFKDWKDKHIK